MKSRSRGANSPASTNNDTTKNRNTVVVADRLVAEIRRSRPGLRQRALVGELVRVLDGTWHDGVLTEREAAAARKGAR